MIELNLTTNSREHELIKKYLEENVSQMLAEKINNGIPIEKDGKTLICKKNLDGFFSYASEEAKKLADTNARSACIEDKTVYGWAIHYFEEDSIMGALYYMDGTEYKPVPKTNTKTPAAPVKLIPSQQSSCQSSLFDLMEQNDMSHETAEEPESYEELDNAVKGKVITEDGEIIDYKEFDGDVNEIVEKQDAIEIKPTGTPLYQRYKRIQDAYPDSVILIRLGDFYETLGQHAIELASELDLTLTGREYGLAERVPMVGFPCNCADVYFKKINAVHNLVIVESDKDSDTDYLPKGFFNAGESTEKDNELVTKLKALFGNVLEVSL